MPHTDKPLKFIPYLFLLAVFTILRWLDFDGFFGQDSYEYLRISKNIADQWFSEAPPTKTIYPPGFPLLGAIAALASGSPKLGLIGISLLSALICLFVSRQILADLYKSPGWQLDLYTTLVLALSPLFLKASQVGMSDMTALVCFMLLIWIGLEHQKKPSIWLLFLAAMVGAIAITTRVATIVVVPFPLLFVGWNSIKNKQYIAIPTSIAIMIVFY